MANRSRVIRRHGSVVRETNWLSISAVFSTLAASGNAALLSSLNAAALALRPFTVIRTHLNWQIETDQSAASEVYIGNIGMAVVSDQASAIGITAVPTPATDLDSDLFFLHASTIGSFVLGDATGFQEIPQSREIDSKAMRKVNSDQDVVIVAEAGIGVSGLELRAVGRMLIKLH